MKKILITYIVFATLNVFAETNFDETKYIRKSYPVNPNVELDVTNKYGNIIIETWEKDSVKFDIEVNVQNKSLGTFKEFLDQIDVRFTANKDNISAQTNWDEPNAFKETAMEIKQLFGSSTDQISVNYKIYVPVTAEVNIDNKFGDITLPNLKNDVIIDLSHGTLRGRNLSGKSTINVKYGKIKLKDVNNMNLELSFSDLEIDNIVKAKINSSSSDLDMDKVKSLVLTSRNDKISIEKMSTLTFNSTLTDIEIESFDDILTGNIKYGALNIESIEPSCERISLTGSKTDVDFEFASTTQSTYSVWLEEGETFSPPIKRHQATKNQNNGESVIYEGKITGSSAKTSEININLKKSFVSFLLVTD